MQAVSVLTQYKCLLILRPNLMTSDLQNIAQDFARELNPFVTELSIVAKGKHSLQYTIKGENRGHFVELGFSSTPKALDVLRAKLRFDPFIIRTLITKVR
jgi:ribosomal protein S6